MKNPPATRSMIGRQLIKTSALFLAPLMLGTTFWLVTSATSIAGPNLCDVCHKNALTLTFACNSLEYRRHIDHGDRPFACGATQINNKKGDPPRPGGNGR